MWAHPDVQAGRNASPASWPIPAVLDVRAVQVRFAASVATRSLMKHAGGEWREEVLFPQLLPPMCLNRYYVAEGVRNYSQVSAGQRDARQTPHPCPPYPTTPP